MMRFTETVEGVFRSINTGSLPVWIYEETEGDWVTETPNGRLLDDVKMSGPFGSFEEAKRNAEAHVAMCIRFKEQGQ